MKEKIRKLAKEKNAIILAHNYQPPEIQDIADLCGDSLELSIKAAKTDADIIVFCGVHFMAETAYILSPQKSVLLPRPDAGCPMADMVSPESLQKKLAELGKMPVVTYVNSPASVKALSDICCTSANAVEVADRIPENEILMVPDRNLAQYTASRSAKKIHLWEGYCPVHERLRPEDIRKARDAHPNAPVLAHPECRPETLEAADVIASTSGMIRYALESEKKEFIIGTETGLLYPLRKACPDKQFYPASEKTECPDMKKISLENVYSSLENMTGLVRVPENIRLPALRAVERMIEK
ncbi:MAG: quinolinate synthase NadA [Desulfococcaceae bacterium]|jgi:quinolinate synthase|nr:quinolinate synthase NadA [Desulfococcaceae bacterium]